jgi:60 kDa SS-A/Ro ribonucleoprotein
MPVMELGTQAPVAASHEGGDVFRADDWTRLDRALIVGSDAGTFYATGRDLSVDNMRAVARCLKEDPYRTMARVAEVSTKGLAPKNDPALMATAIASTSPDTETRLLAWGALPTVARIGTHLFHFMAYRKAIAKKMTVSRMGRTAIANWYGGKDPASLAYDLTKYQSRDGVSHRDILRLYHPTPRSEAHSALYGYAVSGESLDYGAHLFEGGAPDDWRAYLHGVEQIAHAGSEGDVAALIANHNLPREVVPTQWLTSRAVWEALVAKMPVGALIRNLNKLTAVGVFDDPQHASRAADILTTGSVLKRGRIHPIQVLLAARTYAQGHGDKGSLSWTPNRTIVEALDAAFPIAFGAVEASGRRIRLCVDTSQSMTARTTMGLSAREIGAAMALVTQATEPHADLIGFSGHLSDLPIRPGMTLSDVTSRVLSLDASTTYCRLPIEDALKSRAEYDAFVMYTDNETADGKLGAVGIDWTKEVRYGVPSFHVALARYRALVSPATFVVAALSANDIRLSDPGDALSLDIAGMSADVPATIAAFIEGAGGW